MPPTRLLLRIATRKSVGRFARRIAFLVVLCSETVVWGTEAPPDLAGEPFAARSAPRGPTLFSVVRPEDSGIVTTNDYSDPRMWSERYHEFGVGSIGTGVAIGDYDNDGRPDVFVVSKIETCRLFRNLGNWKFEDVTQRAGVSDDSGEWKQGAALADVNNDSLLDIYVCRFAAPNLLFINQGDGTFREEAKTRGLAVIDACGGAAFADFDRDGWLDVYVQTNLLDAAARSHGQRDHLFRNNRDGTFSNVTERVGIKSETQGHSAIWWDYDEDGWPDLYVANDFAAPDSLYHNNRDGTFTDVAGLVVPRTPFSSMGADLGDVNNDGHLDLFVADMAATTHEKDQRGMADTRASLKDADGVKPPVAPQLSYNALYLNTGMGRCLEAARLAGVAATDWTWSPRFEDLDHDGRLDLHVTNGMNREQTNVDLLRGMMAAENPRERARRMKDSPVLAERNLAYRNLGGLRFEETGAAWGLNQHGVSFGSAFGDLDGDGDLDLVFANFEAGVTVLRNDNDRGHGVSVALRGTASNRFGVGATVRLEANAGPQVRQLVLARGYLSTSEPSLHFGLGDDARIDQLTVTWPSGWIQTFRDLAADHRYVITESMETAPTSISAPRVAPQFEEIGSTVGLALDSREEALEGTVAQPLLPLRFNRRGPGLAIGDLDGDGSDEIVIAGTTKAPPRVLKRNGARFAVAAMPALTATSPINDGPPLIFDADANGAADLMLTAGGAALPAEEPEYEPRLLLNPGNGRLAPVPSGALPSLPVSAGAVASADFDRDGRLDLFIGGRVSPGFFPETPPSALFHNRGGRFVDATEQIASDLRTIGMVTSALWSDVDDDGWIDLVIALDWGGVHFFRNLQGRAFQDESVRAGFAAAGTGWWTSLAAADFNGDGRPDFVAGNLGLNTPFHADAAHPEVLFAGDFAGTGTPQLVSGYYENEKLLPRPSRKELGAKIPAVIKRFPQNDRYARASLEEILGPEKLAAATRLQTTELRSGVFLSRADATYRFVPLPRIVQIAPIQGVAAGDFDGDGHADIYAVQNSYAPIPALGRFDGGLSQLLLGDGSGNFTPVPPAESGLVAPGDAKALVVLDLDDDGWPDFLVTRNNSTTLAFRNRGAAGRHMLAIRLRGPPGNPAAIGARITVEFADGSSRTTEVQAGGGFSSQSGATSFFGYTDSRAPLQARVRWPDASSTDHKIPPGVQTLTIAP